MSFLSYTLSTLLILGLTVHHAKACECIREHTTIEHAYRHSAAVYTATVVSAPYSAKGDSPNYSNYDLKIGRVYKGKMNSLSHVISSEGKTCGFVFENGKTYLIYADNELSPKILSVSICSRTKELVVAKQELLELKKLTAQK